MYSDSRVREYWIIDPAADALVQLELSGCQFGELAMLDADDMLTTTLLPGLEIPSGRSSSIGGVRHARNN